jgi:hypothetical protein
LLGFPAVLRVAGRADDHGRPLVQAERIGGQARQLRGAEPGPEGHAVEHGAVGPGEPTERRAGLRGEDEAFGFPGGQGAAAVPTVFLGVEPLDPAHRVVAEPAGFHGPLGERADRGAVMVHRLMGLPPVAEPGQGGLQAVGGQVGQAGRRHLGGQRGGGAVGGLEHATGRVDRVEAGSPGQGDHPRGPDVELVDVPVGQPLGRHAGSPVGQVIGQGRGLVGPEPDGLRVNQPGPDLGGLRFGERGHPLRFAPVGTTLVLAPNPVGFDDTVIPESAALS